MRKMLLAGAVALAVSPVQAANPLILDCEIQNVTDSDDSLYHFPEHMIFREVSGGLQILDDHILAGRIRPTGVSIFTGDNESVTLDRDTGEFMLMSLSAGLIVSGHCQKAQGF